MKDLLSIQVGKSRVTQTVFNKVEIRIGNVEEMKKNTAKPEQIDNFVVKLTTPTETATPKRLQWGEKLGNGCL